MSKTDRERYLAKTGVHIMTFHRAIEDRYMTPAPPVAAYTADARPAPRSAAGRAVDAFVAKNRHRTPTRDVGGTEFQVFDLLPPGDYSTKPAADGRVFLLRRRDSATAVGGLDLGDLSPYAPPVADDPTPAQNLAYRDPDAPLAPAEQKEMSTADARRMINARDAQNRPRTIDAKAVVRGLAASRRAGATNATLAKINRANAAFYAR
jgi:hypothetical protein